MQILDPACARERREIRKSPTPQIEVGANKPRCRPFEVGAVLRFINGPRPHRSTGCAKFANWLKTESNRPLESSWERFRDAESVGCGRAEKPWLSKPLVYVETFGCFSESEISKRFN